MTKDANKQNLQNKTIVFDFGGVLFRTSAAEFYRERFISHGRGEEELQYFLNKIFTHAERSSTHTGNLSDLIEKKVREYPEWEDDIRAFSSPEGFLKHVREVLPGMKEVLEDISASGARIVGLTNWAGDTYDLLPSAYPDLLSHFNSVVVSGKVGMRKPDANIFLHAQAAYGNPDKNDVYYFDDKPANIEAAKQSVGWNAYVFTGADSVRHVLSLPKARPV